MAPNLSILAIPIYYLLTLLPHQMAVSTVLRANNKKWDNANSKSSNWDTQLRQKLPEDIYLRYSRCEAAHRNGMENLPVFMGAVIIGNMAEVSKFALNAFALGYLLLRAVYTVLYVRTTSVKKSYYRTAVWNVSSIWALWIIVYSGFRLA